MPCLVRGLCGCRGDFVLLRLLFRSVIFLFVSLGFAATYPCSRNTVFEIDLCWSFGTLG